MGHKSSVDLIIKVYSDMSSPLNSVSCYYVLMKLSCFYKVGDLGYASELGNYAEYSGAPNEEEVLQYARVVIDVSTLPPP